VLFDAGRARGQVALQHCEICWCFGVVLIVCLQRVDAGAFHGNTGIKEYRFVVESRTRTNEVKKVGGEAQNFAVAVEGDKTK
jgi:hypothetical protein